MLKHRYCNLTMSYSFITVSMCVW